MKTKAERLLEKAQRDYEQEQEARMKTNRYKNYPRKPFVPYKAIIAIPWSDFIMWQGRLKELDAQVKSLQQKIYNSTNQNHQFGHPDVVITDNCARCALTIVLGENYLALHNYNTGASIRNCSDIPDDLEFIVHKVSQGLHYCDECDKWFPLDQMKSYSFAGTVCSKCYDPKRHLPPDTRGD